jgi:hypothetical protein
MLRRYRATRDLAVGVAQPVEQSDADLGAELLARHGVGKCFEHRRESRVLEAANARDQVRETRVSLGPTVVDGELDVESETPFQHSPAERTRSTVKCTSWPKTLRMGRGASGVSIWLTSRVRARRSMTKVRW